MVNTKIDGIPYIKKSAEQLYPDALYLYSKIIKDLNPEDSNKFYEYAVKLGSKLALNDQGRVIDEPPKINIQNNQEEIILNQSSNNSFSTENLNEWKKWERDKLRTFLTNFGWNHWDDSQNISGIKRSIQEIKKASCAFLRGLLSYVNDTTQYSTAVSILEESITPEFDPSFTSRDKADDFSIDFMKQPAFSDPDFVKSIEKNVNSWIKRIELLYYIALAVEKANRKIIDITVPKCQGAIPATWWTMKDDQCLIYGTWKHGFAKYEEINEDIMIPFSCKEILGETLPPSGTLTNRIKKLSNGIKKIFSGSEGDKDPEDEDTATNSATNSFSLPLPPQTTTTTTATATLPKHPQLPPITAAFLPPPPPPPLPTTTTTTAKTDAPKTRSKRWTKKDRSTIFQKMLHSGVYVKSNGDFDWSRFREECGFTERTDEQVSKYVEEIMNTGDSNDNKGQLSDDEKNEADNEKDEKDDKEETEQGKSTMAERAKIRFHMLTRLRRLLIQRSDDDIYEYIKVFPRWKKLPKTWTYHMELCFYKEIANRGWGLCSEILTDPQFIGAFENRNPPNFLTNDMKIIKRLEHFLNFIDKNPLEELRNVNSKDLAERISEAKTNFVPDIKYNEDGSPIMPVYVTSSFYIISLGHIVTDRPLFHNDHYIFPAGYKYSRTYASCADPSLKARYTCEIIDNGGPSPLFRVTMDENPQMKFDGDSVTQPWTGVLNIIRLRGGNGSTKVSGPEFFGLTYPLTAFLIQQMDGSKECTNYIEKKFEQSSNKSISRSLSSSTIKSSQKANLQLNSNQQQGNNQNQSMSFQFPVNQSNAQISRTSSTPSIQPINQKANIPNQSINFQIPANQQNVQIQQNQDQPNKYSIPANQQNVQIQQNQVQPNNYTIPTNQQSIMINMNYQIHLDPQSLQNQQLNQQTNLQGQNNQTKQTTNQSGGNSGFFWPK